MQTTRQSLAAAKADDLLEKPYDIDSLIKVVTKHLDKSEIKVL